MKLDTTKFALAAAVAMGIVYLVCAVLVALVPDFALDLFGWLTHLVNTDQFATGVTFGSAFIGFIQVVLYTYIAIFLFAWLHNSFIKT